MSEKSAQDCEPGEATGGATGIEIPVDPQALLEAGAEWLTSAFRAYGAIPRDNAVTRIVRSEPFEAGNSGDKLVLSVEYARPDPAIHRELFVKFSRCLGDPFRDRRAHELHGEVRLADLSRHPAFPVAVAKPYFADFDPASGNGVLITQRIVFGQGGIEPLHVKNMDHLLAHPEHYYRATVTALARLAAAHQSGRLAPEADRLFPFDPAKAEAELPLPWTAEEVREKAERTAAFLTEMPQLFRANVTSPEFARRFVEDAVRFQRHDHAIRRFLYSDPRFVALAHWNTHIDNAWFWRDEHGVLQAGLLDWGMVRQMNLAIALFGGLSGGNLDLWDAHLDSLLALFLDELAEHGGAKLDPRLFRLHFDLAIGTLTLALMMDATAMFIQRMPDLASASGPDDPLLHRDKVVHGFLHTLRAALDLWEHDDFGARLSQMLEIVGEAA